MWNISLVDITMHTVLGNCSLHILSSYPCVCYILPYTNIQPSITSLSHYFNEAYKHSKWVNTKRVLSTTLLFSIQNPFVFTFQHFALAINGLTNLFNKPQLGEDGYLCSCPGVLNIASTFWHCLKTCIQYSKTDSKRCLHDCSRTVPWFYLHN